MRAKTITVGPTNYTIKKRLGEGTFGCAYKVLSLDDGKVYVVKIIKPLVDSGGVLPGIKEIENLKKIQETTNTLKLVDHGITENNKVVIVTDFVGSNSLRDKVLETQQYPWTAACFSISVEESLDLSHKIEAINIMIKLLKAIFSIHETGLVHRDIKPENIIWNGEELLLIDFGLSGTVGNTDTVKKSVFGTLRYMDLAALNGQLTPASDYHAFVVTAHEILTGFCPSILNATIMNQMFAAKDFQNNIRNITRDDKKAPIFEFLLNLADNIDDIVKDSSKRQDLLKKLDSILETLNAVKQDGRAVYFASEEFCGDKEVVMAAVTQNGNALEFASETLRADRKFILEAVKQNGYALRYASEELQRDREVVLEAVKQSWRALRYASEEFRGDKEVVMAAVKQNGFALQVASEKLKGDREFMLEAVKQNGIALYYASAALKGDRDVVRAAVKQNWNALEFASETFRADRKFILEKELDVAEVVDVAGVPTPGPPEYSTPGTLQSLEYSTPGNSQENQPEEDQQKSQ